MLRWFFLIKEFGNDRRHDPRTAEYTLNAINVLCKDTLADGWDKIII